MKLKLQFAFAITRDFFSIVGFAAVIVWFVAEKPALVRAISVVALALAFSLWCKIRFAMRTRDVRSASQKPAARTGLTRLRWSDHREKNGAPLVKSGAVDLTEKALLALAKDADSEADLRLKLIAAGYSVRRAECAAADIFDALMEGARA